MARSAFRRVFLLGAYHGAARWLPPTRSPGGELWRRIRSAVGGPLLAARGHHINIEHGANIGRGEQLSVGSRSSVGINASVHGPCSIGQDVMMGPEVMIFALGHRTDSTEVPMIDQGFVEPRPVVIEDDVWIGARAVILPGVTIGQGSIVGAAAVVTRSVPPFSVVAGNPARIVSNRRASRVAS